MTFELQESITWKRVQISKYFGFFFPGNLQSTSKIDICKILEIELKWNGYIEDSIISWSGITEEILSLFSFGKVI